MIDVAKFLLENEMISVLPSVWNWEDAVKRGANLLVNKGYATKKYTEAIIKNTKENGAYYALVPNVVMPHARPELGGVKNGISLLIIKNGVKFQSENDPINVVLTVTSDTTDNFSDDIIPSIADFLENTDLINKLKKASNNNEVRNILSNATKPVESSIKKNNCEIINAPYFILTVCGVGMGSSLILRMAVEKVLAELNMVNTKVEHTDVSTASSIKADFILTSDELSNILKTKTNIPIGIVKDYTSQDEIRNIIQQLLLNDITKLV